jgi:Flp pilus assembly protein TadD
VFVDAPSREEQAERMRGRGDAPERIAQRVEKATEEAAAAAELGMRLLVNDDLERALAELRWAMASGTDPVLVVGALSFFPALALGPIVEQFEIRSAAAEVGR